MNSKESYGNQHQRRKTSRSQPMEGKDRYRNGNIISRSNKLNEIIFSSNFPFCAVSKQGYKYVVACFLRDILYIFFFYVKGYDDRGRSMKKNYNIKEILWFRFGNKGCEQAHVHGRGMDDGRC